MGYEDLTARVLTTTTSIPSSTSWTWIGSLAMPSRSIGASSRSRSPTSASDYASFLVELGITSGMHPCSLIYRDASCGDCRLFVHHLVDGRHPSPRRLSCRQWQKVILSQRQRQSTLLLTAPRMKCPANTFSANSKSRSHRTEVRPYPR